MAYVKHVSPFTAWYSIYSMTNNRTVIFALFVYPLYVQPNRIETDPKKSIL